MPTKKYPLRENKLIIEVPDYYEFRRDLYGVLEMFFPKGKTAIIKFLIIDSTEGVEQEQLYNDKKNRNSSVIKIHDDKFYSVYSHCIELDGNKLFVTSFELIYRHYYINIRVNTMEEITGESKENLVAHIHSIILTIDEMNS